MSASSRSPARTTSDELHKHRCGADRREQNGWSSSSGPADRSGEARMQCKTAPVLTKGIAMVVPLNTLHHEVECQLFSCTDDEN